MTTSFSDSGSHVAQFAGGSENDDLLDLYSDSGCEYAPKNAPKKVQKNADKNAHKIGGQQPLNVNQNLNANQNWATDNASSSRNSQSDGSEGSGAQSSPVDLPKSGFKGAAALKPVVVTPIFQGTNGTEDQHMSSFDPEPNDDRHSRSFGLESQPRNTGLQSGPKMHSKVGSSTFISGPDMDMPESHSYFKSESHDQEDDSKLESFSADSQPKSETSQLEALVLQYQSRLIDSHAYQTQLEQEIQSKDDVIASLKEELKIARQDQHRAEETAYLERLNHHNDKIQWRKTEAQLRKRLDELSAAATVAKKTQNVNSSSHGKDAELMLVKQQMEVMTKEYSLRFEQVREEITEVKQINQRLMEENEGFQLLLAEKTIVTGQSLKQELESAEQQTGDEQIGDPDDTIEVHKTNGSTENVPLMSINGSDPSTYSDMQFELDALKNQNEALKASLKRFVLRLLDFHEFEIPLKERTSVTQRSVSEFQTRMYRQELLRAPSPAPSLSHSPCSTLCSPPDSPVTTKFASTSTSSSTSGSVLSPVSAFFTFKAPKTASSWSHATPRVPSGSSSHSRTELSHKMISMGLDELYPPVIPIKRTMSMTSDSSADTASSVSTGSVAGSVIGPDKLQQMMSQVMHSRRPSIETQCELRPLTLVP